MTTTSTTRTTPEENTTMTTETMPTDNPEKHADEIIKAYGEAADALVALFGVLDLLHVRGADHLVAVANSVTHGWLRPQPLSYTSGDDLLGLASDIRQAIRTLTESTDPLCDQERSTPTNEEEITMASTEITALDAREMPCTQLQRCEYYEHGDDRVTLVDTLQPVTNFWAEVNRRGEGHVFGCNGIYPTGYNPDGSPRFNGDVCAAGTNGGDAA